jgi:hypothetical protein
MADTNITKQGHLLKLVDNGDGTFSHAVELLKGGTYIGGTNPLQVKSNGSQVYTTITRPNNTTAYTAGDVVGADPASNMIFAEVARSNGSDVIIMGCHIQMETNAVPSGMGAFRLHLYSAAPTAIADNSAYNLPSGDRASYLGFINLDTPKDLGDTLWSENNNVNKKIQLASNSTSLYGIVETIGAFTPAASVVMEVTLEVVEV